MKSQFVRLLVCLIVIVLFASVTVSARNNDKKEAQKELKSMVEMVQNSLPMSTMGMCVEKIGYKKNNIEITIDITDFLTKPQMIVGDFNLTPFIDDEAALEIVRRARPSIVVHVIAPEENKTFKMSADEFIKYLDEDKSIVEVSR